MEERERKRWSSIPLSLLYFLLFTLILLSPHLPGIQSRLFADMEFTDTVIMTWVYDHFRESILSLRSPFTAEDIFFPFGIELEGVVWNSLLPLLSIPFQIIFPFPASLNLYFIAIIVLNGFCAFLLGRQIFGRDLPALVLGSIFAFNPFTIREMKCGRVDPMATFFIPLFLLFFIKTLKGMGRGSPLLSGASFALLSLSNWAYAAFTSLFALPILVHSLLYKSTPISLSGGLKKGMGRVALMAFLSSALIFPFFLSIIAKSGKIPHGLGMIDYPSYRSIMEDPEHSIYRYTLMDSMNPLYPIRKPSQVGHTASILPLVTFLSLLLFILDRKRSFLWLIEASIFYILSLGPYLMTGANSGRGESEWPLPLPYIYLVKFFPLFHRFYFPSRFLPFVLLPLGVMAGSGVAGMGRRRLKRIQVVLILLFPLFLILHLKISGYRIITSKISIHPFYLSLREEGGDPVLIEYPLKGQSLTPFLQTIHNKRTVNGLWAEGEMIWPEEYRRFIMENTILKFLFDFYEGGGHTKGTLLIEDVKRLKGLGIRYITIYEGNIMNRGDPRDEMELLRRGLEGILGPARIWGGRPALFLFELSGWVPNEGEVPCPAGPVLPLEGEEKIDK